MDVGRDARGSGLRCRIVGRRSSETFLRERRPSSNYVEDVVEVKVQLMEMELVRARESAFEAFSRAAARTAGSSIGTVTTRGA